MTQNLQPTQKIDQLQYKKHLLAQYDNNCAIDEKRNLCTKGFLSSSKMYQNLCLKLDILQKDFLTPKDKKLYANNEEFCEAYYQLNEKLQKCEAMPQKLREKLRQFMSVYANLHNNNVKSCHLVLNVKNQIQKMEKQTSKLKEQLFQQQKLLNQQKYLSSQRIKGLNGFQQKASIIYG